MTQSTPTRAENHHTVSCTGCYLILIVWIIAAAVCAIHGVHLHLW